jgi:hypothetical protein
MPRGDVSIQFAVAAERVDQAEAALREAGFRVRREGEAGIDASKASGSENPDADAQRAVHEAAESALRQRGIEYEFLGSGVTSAGGTPEHAWVTVTVDGHPTNHKILVANDAEADAELDQMASELGLERDRLNIAPPPGWAGYGPPADDG